MPASSGLGQALGRRPVEDDPEGARKANRARNLLDKGIGINAVGKALKWHRITAEGGQSQKATVPAPAIAVSGTRSAAAHRRDASSSTTP